MKISGLHPFPAHGRHLETSWWPFSKSQLNRLGVLHSKYFKNLGLDQFQQLAVPFGLPVLHRVFNLIYQIFFNVLYFIMYVTMYHIIYQFIYHIIYNIIYLIIYDILIFNTLIFC